MASTAPQAATAAESPLFSEAATALTRGAAGWDHFVIDSTDYLVVANFFTSSPGRQPSMTTDSAIYEASVAEDGLKLKLTFCFCSQWNGYGSDALAGST